MRDNSFNAIDSIAEVPVTTLPAPPSEEKDLGIVAPDRPAVHVETNDRTVTHSVCHADVLMPGAAYDTAVANNGVLYCPTCRNTFPVDQFDRRAR
jgi:uncharacterized protein YbaR (Trm112 family)